MANQALIDRINERLTAMELKPRTASLRAGLGADAIRSIQRGKSANPRLDTLARLAPVLGTTVEYLSTGRGSAEAPGARAAAADAAAAGAGPAPGDETTWLAARLDAAGRSVSGLAAALGIAPADAAALVAGRRAVAAAEIPALAAYLGMQVRDILSMVVDAATAPRHIFNAESPTPATMTPEGGGAATVGFRHAPEFGPRDLPVRGVAAAGTDALFITNGEPHDWLLRPAVLIGVTEAYAVIAAGTSMEPRYFDGEVLYVHPGRRVAPGPRTFVVVQFHPEVEGEAPPALIKKYERQTASELVLSQYNPPKELRFPIETVKSIHLIVGPGDIR